MISLSFFILLSLHLTPPSFQTMNSTGSQEPDPMAILSTKPMMLVAELSGARAEWTGGQYDCYLHCGQRTGKVCLQAGRSFRSLVGRAFPGIEAGYLRRWSSRSFHRQVARGNQGRKHLWKACLSDRLHGYACLGFELFSSPKCGRGFPRSFALAQREEGKPPEKLTLHNTRTEAWAIRVGEWNLIEGKSGYHSGRNQPWEEKRSYPADDKQAIELYHYAKDPSQRVNLAQKFPKKVAELQKALKGRAGSGLYRT